ncbi:glucose-repressible protein [Puccinia sorghi]|uniref:Glucose-repressible protein n=1 Tax=Puccinia sorghi TaxID=27349 RepID=A0A0L6VKD0_9BASI|nr:glucose-repressible protein [Puccinia sorghi]
MQTAKDAMNYVSDKASELTNTASKEANKNIAKDSDNSLSSRAGAAKDAVGDKASEMKDGASAEVNKSTFVLSFNGLAARSAPTTGLHR